jgi:lipopolysaccharide export system protein LptA
LQGFQSNRGKPIKIAATQLEVRDKEKIATFSGDVHVVQGDTDLRCKVLVIYYEDDPGNAGAPAAQAGAGSGQQIRRMEARNNVIVTQKDQTATGDNGDYDMRADTVTLTGNVVVTQGQNVLRGQKLVVNTTTGASRMETPSGGRVEGLFQSSVPKGENQGALPRPRTN